MAKKKIRILSIDGGGIRGVIPAVIINYIENELRRKEGDDVRICDYFDMIAGTSTGGILTCAYLMPDPENPGRPKLSAEDALNIYMKRGGNIFDVHWLHNIKTVAGLLDEKYDALALEQAMEEYFGDTKLSDLLKPCMITAYDIKNRSAKFFTSANATSPLKDYKLKYVARATSAAPTYFEPVRITSEFGTPYELVDGGVFANNPSMCAYAEARKISFAKILSDPLKTNKPKAKDMIIVSVGTGTECEEYPFDKMKDKGLAGWVKPIIDILMSGNSETVNYHLKKMYSTLRGDDKFNYHRLEPSLHHARPKLDDASGKNLKRLNEAGLIFVDKNYDELNLIIDKLIANK
ncbi:MAG: patatin [Bacteroidetes bacterium]|nr:patatin [Bacteroidota bacterium]